MLLLALSGAGCSSSSAPRRVQPGAPHRRTTTSSLSVTTVRPTHRNSSAAAPPRPERLQGPLRVTQVVDGDTIKVSNGRTLRLIGVDTPETVDPRKPVQCFGREASARAHALLDGAEVQLEYDATQGRLDKYGRTLAYVWMADGRLYNETIIAEGYAHEYTYAIPYRYQDAFRAAERSARQAERGLWAPTTCAGDTSGSLDTGGSPRPGSGCDPSYLGVCIPPPPPDLDCPDIAFRDFKVVGADPHNFDTDRDGVGCEQR